MADGFNRFAERVLRSPLYPLMGPTMLITLTGRKSGQPVTLPVNFWRQGDHLIVFSRHGRKWWLNLRGGAPVKMRIRGRDREGLAEVIGEDEETVARLMSGVRGLSPEKAAQRAKDSVVLRITFDDTRR